MVNYFIKFNRKDIKKNYIKTKREFKIFYKKGIGILLEIMLGNIKKEKLEVKKLAKGNGWAIKVANNSASKLFFFFTLVALRSCIPYLWSKCFLKYSFL